MLRGFHLPPPTALLSPGTVVGSWRVVDLAGRGVYGAVYRAAPVNAEHGPLVALKIALRPRDPRFAREAELLSRTHHPSVPRLVDSGAWNAPGDVPYPFIATEWVEGTPLYDWARQNPPSPQQVFKLLAQLAGALAALHAHEGIHRDVKGDNVLVRHSDGRAMLMDFGMGRYPGVITLTPPGTYPGTPAYRSPESSLFELQFLRNGAAHYAAAPSDDVYALGVTACRLVTGGYPVFSEPRKDERGTWHLDAVIPPPSLVHLEPRLRDMILRMLSVRPEERGTAAQLAEALEQAMEPSSPRSTPPLSPELPAATRTPSVSTASRERSSPWEAARPWFWAAATGLLLMAWMGGRAVRESMQERAIARAEAAKSSKKDKGTTALGEAAAAMSTEEPPHLSAREMMAEDTLPEPLPGQMEPDARGKCPHKQQVALNGGCWGLVSRQPEECEALSGQMFKGSCYIPIFKRPQGRPRLPTSGPTKRATPR